MRTRLLAITLAAVLALVGVVAILAYVRQANERAVNGLKAETVYWATGPIAAGTSLQQAQQGGLLGTEKVPESSLASGAETGAVQSITGANRHKVVTSSVAKGQILLQNMLGASASNVSASGGFVIPKGDIAISVTMCVPEDVAEYVTPGAKVAVFDTVVTLTPSQQMTPSCNSGHPAFGINQLQDTPGVNTVLVLSGVEVLAVGPNPGSQSTSGSSNVAAATEPLTSSASSGDVLVTFAVDQQDAERLILLQEVGIPYLGLLGSSSSVSPQGPVSLFPNQP